MVKMYEEIDWYEAEEAISNLLSTDMKRQYRFGQISEKQLDEGLAKLAEESA